MHLSSRLRAGTRPRLLAALFLACSLTGPAQAYADLAWEPEGRPRDGIALYTRHVPGQPLKDFKGVMQIDAPLAQVAATLADVSTLHEWFYLVKEARFIKGERVDDSYIYLAIKGIWPVSPRDVAAHVVVKQDPATLAIVVKIDSEDGVVPPQPGYVRMPDMTSRWTLRPLSATRTEVEVEGHGDPGGWIPTAIANFAVTTLPRESLARMRLHVARPEYRDAEKIYAKNPKLRELGNRLVFPK